MINTEGSRRNLRRNDWDEQLAEWDQSAERGGRSQLSPSSDDPLESHRALAPEAEEQLLTCKESKRNWERLRLITMTAAKMIICDLGSLTKQIWRQFCRCSRNGTRRCPDNTPLLYQQSPFHRNDSQYA